MEAGFEVALWHQVLLAVVSVVVGLVGGMTGLALGVLRLPLLIVLGFPPSLAAGTNIGVSALGALGGSIRHIKEGRVIPRLVVVMGVPSLVGAFLGGYYGGGIPDGLILSVVAGLIGWSGVSMLFQAHRQRMAVATPGGDGGGEAGSLRVGSQEDGSAYEAGRLGVQVSIGGVIGLLGGAVGLLLGSLRLPAMIHVLRISIHGAVGTNLAIGFTVGVFGFGGHLLRDEVELSTWLVMGVGAVIGAYLGARQTGRLSDRALRFIIGLILCAMSVVMMYQALEVL